MTIRTFKRAKSALARLANAAQEAVCGLLQHNDQRQKLVTEPMEPRLLLSHVPVVTTGGGQQIREGTAIDVLASFTDADSEDTHTASINWGDGQIENVDAG